MTTSQSMMSERREEALGRLEEDRVALAATLNELLAPVHVIEQWALQSRQLLPILPLVLAALALALVAVKLLSRRRLDRPALPTRQRSFLTTLLRLLAAYRVIRKSGGLVHALNGPESGGRVSVSRSQTSNDSNL